MKYDDNDDDIVIIVVIINKFVCRAVDFIATIFVSFF